MPGNCRQIRRPVKVVWIKDALHPRDSAISRDWPYIGNGCVADYIPADVPITDNTLLTQNGHLINRDRWHNRGVFPGDEIRIATLPGAIGFFGSLFFTIAATVVLSTALSYGIGYLSSLLIDPPEIPEEAPSGSYGADLIGTEHSAGHVIPIVYGQHVVGGTVISTYIGHLLGETTRRGIALTSMGKMRALVVNALATGPIQSIGGYTADANELHLSPQKLNNLTVGYNYSGYTPCCHGGINYPPYTKTAFHWANPNPYTTQRVVAIRLRLQRFGTIVAGKKIAVRIQEAVPSLDPGLKYGEPSGIDRSPTIEAYAAPMRSGLYDLITFSFDHPVELTEQYYFVVIDADYAASTTNYIGLAAVGQTPGNIAYLAPGGWTPCAPNIYNACADVICAPINYGNTNGEIKLDGTPIETVAGDGNLSIRLGSLGQEALPGLAKLSHEQMINELIPIGTGHYLEHTTTQGVDGFAVLLWADQGIWRIDSSNRRTTITIRVEIDWRVNGTTAWTGYYCDDNGGYIEGPCGLIYRFDFPTDPNSANSQYRGQIIDVRVRLRNDQGERTERIGFPMLWKSLRELSDREGSTYPHMALVAINADFGSTVGSLSRITSLIEGRRMWVWSGTAWTYTYSANPADCCLDWLINERIGGARGLTLANIDLPYFVLWRNYCDESISDGNGGTMPRWEIGLVIDQAKTHWDWATAIAACGRAKLVWNGKKIRPVIDQASDPVQVFSAGNVVAGSAKLQPIGKKRRANEVEIKFRDQTKSYVENSVKEHADGIREAGERDIVETVEILGITHPIRAKRAAKYLCNQQRYINWIAEFDTFIEAVGCEPGDVVAISSDAFNWEAIGGLLKENAPNVNTIILDRDLVIDASGDPYQISVRSISGGAFILQTANVCASTGTYVAGTTLTIRPSWPTITPQAGDRYSVMPIRDRENVTSPLTETGGKLAKVISMKLTEDFFVRIKAVQYDERIYNDKPSDDTSLPPGMASHGAVIPFPPTNLQLQMQSPGQGYDPRISASWTNVTWPLPFKCAIYSRILFPATGAPWMYQGETDGTEYIIGPVSEWTGYEIAVCPRAPLTGRHNDPNGDHVAKRRIYITRCYDHIRTLPIGGLSY